VPWHINSAQLADHQRSLASVRPPQSQNLRSMANGGIDRLADRLANVRGLPVARRIRPISIRLTIVTLQGWVVLHTAFYKFVAVAAVEAVVADLRQLAHGLTGGIIVAEEGISGVAAGEAAAIAAFEQALCAPTCAGGAFAGMAFKRSSCTTPPFGRMKVSRKPEIVALGLTTDTSIAVQSPAHTPGYTAAHHAVSPQAWRQLIVRDDVVVLDNRNGFEYRLGRFNRAIDPDVAYFRDFPGYIEAQAEVWRRDRKTVAMYCTGGVRCEKSSAWLAGLGLDVAYLDGGILNYFATMPDAGHDWQGECFVFDNRIALDTSLQETATTAEQVYADEPDAPWRISRARRLLAAVTAPTTPALDVASLAASPGQPLGRPPAAARAPRPTRPPTCNGIGPSSVTQPGQVAGWPTVLDFLSARFAGIARAVWAARIASGRVIDEHGALITATTPCVPHRKLYYYRELATEPRIPFDEVVLFQDEVLVVADKPHFLPCIPSGRYVQETLLTRLKRRLGLDTLAPIHRIDMDTAGLVAFSIQPATRDRYHQLFRDRKIEKVYECVAAFDATLTFPRLHRSRLQPASHFMQMHEVAGEANAETHIELLHVRGDRAHYRLRPVTGQKHQLRVQMAALGLPIVNDRLYPALQADGLDAATDYSAPLQLLARSLAFTDPVTGAARRFESQLRLTF
jgi:tRNA pseudouridine32 synthase / 23S rRNA pseudouridine746 synthase